MKTGVQVLKGVNSHMTITFLNADLERNGEADSKNQILKNNKDYFNRPGHLALIIIKSSLLMGYKWDKPKTFMSRKETANELLLRNRPSFKTIDPMRN